MPAQYVRAKRAQRSGQTHPSQHSTIEVAPGIYAANHSAEERFYLQQAFQMKQMAANASIKQKNKTEVKGLKKGLGAALDCLKAIQDETNTALSSARDDTAMLQAKDERISQLEEQLEQHVYFVGFAINRISQLLNQVECKNVNIERLIKEATEVKATCERVMKEKDATVGSLRERAAELQKQLVDTTEERDQLQSKFDASDASFADLATEFEKCHNEREGLKSKYIVWQAAVELTRVTEERFKRELAVSESKLTKSNEALAIEKGKHSSTTKQLEDARQALSSTKHSLNERDQELSDMHKKRDELHERLATTHSELLEKDHELQKAKDEHRAATEEANRIQTTQHTPTEHYETNDSSVQTGPFDVDSLIDGDINVADITIAQSAVPKSEREEEGDEEMTALPTPPSTPVGASPAVKEDLDIGHAATQTLHVIEDNQAELSPIPSRLADSTVFAAVYQHRVEETPVKKSRSLWRRWILRLH